MFVFEDVSKQEIACPFYLVVCLQFYSSTKSKSFPDAIVISDQQQHDCSINKCIPLLVSFIINNNDKPQYAASLLK